MRVLVAGGSGFLGRACCARLRAEGHDVVVASRHASARPIAGTTAIDLDLGQPIDPAAVGACTAIVNLVGIARVRGNNDFARAHVAAAQHLVALAEARAVDRLVHVGVIDTPAARSPYHDSKRAAEAIVRGCARPWTILRPSAVFGPGDQLVTSLATQIRTAAIFPVPRTRGPLALVDVDDVAAAIAAALVRPAAIGGCYDLVGPDVLDVRDMVRVVAAALELPTWTPAVPDALLAVVARAGEAMLAAPPLARSQLVMLQTGLAGDGTAARRDLGIVPRAFDRPRIAALARAIPSPAMSLRIAPSADHRRWLAEIPIAGAAWAWALGLMVAMLVLPAWVPGIWPRMLAIEAVAAALALALVHAPWRALLRPRPAMIGRGLAGAVILYIGSRLGVAAIAAVAPGLAAQLGPWNATIGAIDPAVAALLLPAVVLGEDISFRVGMTLVFARRVGPLAACLLSGLAFAVAHATSGPPILVLAALVLGTIWSAVLVRTRSLAAVFTMHLAWDALVMFGPPLG